MSDLIKGVLHGVKKEILSFAEIALKSGATNISTQLLNVTRNENQPTEFNLGSLTTALKSGVTATGQELMAAGLERVKTISSQDQTSKASEKSARTKKAK